MSTKIDPYYRIFPSNTTPSRTPFSRSGYADANHFFIYMTNRKKWSLLLDKARLDQIFAEAQTIIPIGYNQLWLFEKIYSTKKAKIQQTAHGSTPLYESHKDYPADIERCNWPEQLFVVLMEPYLMQSHNSHVLSYHLHEHEAINTANDYTFIKNRRAVVGKMLWDAYWH